MKSHTLISLRKRCNPTNGTKYVAFQNDASGNVMLIRAANSYLLDLLRHQNLIPTDILGI